MKTVLAETDHRLKEGGTAGAQIWPSGFPVLDRTLGGGFRSGELVLVGGAQGVGKTTFVQQVLRNTVANNRVAVYFSFGHDAHTVLQRLIALEAAEIAGPHAVQLHSVRHAFEARHTSALSSADRLAQTAGGGEALQALESYADRLHLHTSSGSGTTIALMRETVEQVARESGQPPLLVVDHVQKIHVPGVSPTDDEQSARAVEGLKDLAVQLGVPVLAIVSAEKQGLVPGKRMRVHDLRGSSTLAYEADIVLVLNNKYDVVARHHLMYDVGNADRFRSWVVLTLEKNRNGVDKVELEFLKRFEQGRFDPQGRQVTEQLVDERIYVE